MVTNRRRYSRTRAPVAVRRTKWTDWAVAFLAGDSPLNPYGADMDGMEEYWREYGKEITRTYAADAPGERCPAWWAWSAPEPREEGEEALEYLERHGLLFLGELEAAEVRIAKLRECESRFHGS